VHAERADAVAGSQEGVVPLDDLVEQRLEVGLDLAMTPEYDSSSNGGRGDSPTRISRS
jgi:hypothetical protein